mmetsp:Transcript_2358/g.7055  ORF Transcript_2358/g.7055 Transcript_2358/m.7055 type:complete len:188 (-) Transcript_2358:738-1301(-)
MDIAKVAQLGENLETACRQFDMWASEQVSANEVLKRNHLKTMDNLMGDISKLEKREQELKQEKVAVQDRLELEKHELKDIQASISRLEARYEALPQRRSNLLDSINKFTRDITNLTEECEKTSAEKNEKLEEISLSHEKLQRLLGLKVQTDYDKLHFIFNNVDPSDPSREFTITFSGTSSDFCGKLA